MFIRQLYDYPKAVPHIPPSNGQLFYEVSCATYRRLVKAAIHFFSPLLKYLPQKPTGGQPVYLYPITLVLFCQYRSNFR